MAYHDKFLTTTVGTPMNLLIQGLSDVLVDGVRSTGLPRIGRPPKAPRLVADRKSTHRDPMLLIKDGRKERSTGFRVSQRAEAEAALTVYIANKLTEGTRKTNIADLLVTDILQLAIDKARPIRADSKKSRSAKKRLRNTLAEAQTFFKGTPLGKINGTESDYTAYLAWLTEPVVHDGSDEVTVKPVKRNKLSTASRKAQVVQRAIDAFFHNRLDAVSPEWAGKVHTERRDLIYGRNMIARLHWAARGRIWDANANGGRGGWKTKKVVDEATGEVTLVHELRSPEVIKARRFVCDFIRIARDTGSREQDIRDLQIKPSTGGGYIEFSRTVVTEDKTVFFPPRIHRGGAIVREDEKNRHTSAITPRMEAVFRRLRRRAHILGATHYLHDANGNSFDYNQSAMFKQVVIDAGLSMDCCQHAFRHTLAYNLSRTPGVNHLEAAAFIGMSFETYYRTYINAQGFTGDGVTALQQLETFARENPDGPVRSLTKREAARLSGIE